jgi:hypothetical protein
MGGPGRTTAGGQSEQQHGGRQGNPHTSSVVDGPPSGTEAVFRSFNSSDSRKIVGTNQANAPEVGLRFAFGELLRVMTGQQSREVFDILCALWGPEGGRHMGMRGVVSKHERLRDER